MSAGGGSAVTLTADERFALATTRDLAADHIGDRVRFETDPAALRVLARHLLGLARLREIIETGECRAERDPELRGLLRLKRRHVLDYIDDTRRDLAGPPRHPRDPMPEQRREWIDGALDEVAAIDKLLDRGAVPA